MDFLALFSNKIQIYNYLKNFEVKKKYKKQNKN